jgi:signal transduction histidine kinase
VRVGRKRGGACIEVVDTGRGIPAEYHAKIFEKFGQLEDGQHIGTGLGLTFCKLALEAHGGGIGVESVVGEGSTFWCVLPT